jgi:hypothetical protein
MTTKPNAGTRIPIGPKPPASPASGARSGRRGRKFGVAVLGAAALATVGALAWGTVNWAHATVPTNCAAALSRCGYPDATNTGVPTGTTLKSVPSQVSSGPGWSWNAAYGELIVKGNGTVLSGLYISGNLDIQASNVTVKNVKVVTSGTFGISLRHTKGVTIENSTISGKNSTTGRVNSAISDVYADSTGMVVKDNNISNFRIGIMFVTGLVEGNYIHDPGYIAGDHTNGIMAIGTTQPLTIENNTVLNNLGQTDAITLNASGAGQAVANKTVADNFLAGGDYVIYGGAAWNDPTSNIVIVRNRFGQLYSPKGCYYGPVAYFDSTGKGNVWSGNVWDTTGKAIPS